MEEEIPDLKQMTPREAFAAFFNEVAGRNMDDDEIDFLNDILLEIGEVQWWDR